MVITDIHEDLSDGGAPPGVTWAHLGGYYDSLSGYLKRTISPVGAPELPTKYRIRMLWLCYRESPDFAMDLP